VKKSGQEPDPARMEAHFRRLIAERQQEEAQARTKEHQS